MTRRQPDLKVIQGSPHRLRPPPDLSEAEKQTFIDIVASVDAKHFVSSDLPLVASYAIAINQERLAQHHLRTEGHVFAGHPSPWMAVAEKAHRAMMSLSTRLRLSPQGRARTKIRPGKVSAYEKMELESDDNDD